MYSNTIKKLSSTVILLVSFLLLVGCGGGSGGGGEQSDDTLLGDANTPPQAYQQDLTITPGNTNEEGTVGEDGALSIVLRGTDAEGDALTYTVLTQPTHGTLSGTASDLTYVPDANYYGEDDFTYKVNDGVVDSLPATIHITVTSVNDAPIAVDDSVTIDEDTGIMIDVLANDSDSDGMLESHTLTVVMAPSKGRVTVMDGKIHYTPEQDYRGTDSFRYTIKDNGGLLSNEATVEIIINAVNDIPLAQAQDLATLEDTSVDIVLVGTDADRDTLTYTVLSQPTHGTLSGTAPGLTYIPSTNYNGSDSFTFKVNDGSADSAEAVVRIAVTPVNDVPIAADDTVSTEEDAPIVIDILANDSDSDGTLDSATLHVVSDAIQGTLTLINGKASYTPNLNYHGVDSFSYTVQDNEGVVSNVAQVQIRIAPVNDAPVAVDDSATTPENISIAIDPLLNDTDPDGNVSDLRIVSITQPYSGSALLEGNRVYYAPPSGHAQEDNLTYTIEDKDGGRAAGLMRITILPVNEAPTAHNQIVHTPEETPINFELNATDPDGDSLHYHIALFPAHGTLAGDAPSLRYLPNTDYNGEDYIAYTVDDGNLTSSTAVVTIAVDPINDSPVANAGEGATGVRGDTIRFDASGSFDPDGTITSYVWQEGNSTLSTEKIFDQKMLEEGTHTITLTVTDDHNATDSDEKVVTIGACCQGCAYPDPTSTNPFQ